LATPEYPRDLTKQILARWGAVNRRYPDDFVRANADHQALSERAFCKLNLFGRSVATGYLRIGDSRVPAFLPEEALGSLPLLSQFDVCALVYRHPRQLEFEAHPEAYRIVVLQRPHETPT
jgi:hypothetical protein